ncbi:MAG: hypothetical protein O2854_00090 [Chloroflexi bacterium]|nr:hypothetical protein [Chloroflexota bacterium]
MPEDKPSGDIHGLAGPVSEAFWSPDFVMQSIEILPVLLRDGTIWSFTPEHADSFMVAWPAQSQPEDIAVKAAKHLGLDTVVLHSTSWRHVDKEVVLTYIAVVSPDTTAPEFWKLEEVGRAELARGGATAPPSSIGVSQVVEHALRHLAWLRKDDPVIRDLLADWAPALEDYVPEPFRSFAGPPV